MFIVIIVYQCKIILYTTFKYFIVDINNIYISTKGLKDNII